MRNFLEPTNEMKLIINQTLDDLSISSKQYIVIHIRSGDSYLKGEKNTFTNGYIHTLIDNIKNDINRENNYLLIADSNDVKKIIKNYFPNFKTLIKPITHFGEGIVLEEEKVKNTLIDFYLLSQSKEIFSYSTYKHGRSDFRCFIDHGLDCDIPDFLSIQSNAGIVQIQGWVVNPTIGLKIACKSSERFAFT
jgi:hypothetical protein